MSNYRDANTEWEDALRAANNDKDIAHGLLLARIVVELQEQQMRLKAMAEALGVEADAFTV